MQKCLFLSFESEQEEIADVSRCASNVFGFVLEQPYFLNLKGDEHQFPPNKLSVNVCVYLFILFIYLLIYLLT